MYETPPPPRPPTQMRLPTSGMRQNGQSSLYDALGSEIQRQNKLKEIRRKYGRPEPLQKKAPKGIGTQYMGDNRG